MTWLISFFQMDFSYAQIIYPDSFKNHGVLNKYPWVRLKQLKSNYEFSKVKIWQTHYPGRDKVLKSRNCLALVESGWEKINNIYATLIYFSMDILIISYKTGSTTLILWLKFDILRSFVKSDSPWKWMKWQVEYFFGAWSFCLLNNLVKMPNLPGLS